MTHGEAYVLKREQLITRQMKSSRGEDVTISLPKRMSKEEAIAYYKNKFNRYWKEKGVKE